MRPRQRELISVVTVFGFACFDVFAVFAFDE